MDVNGLLNNLFEMKSARCENIVEAKNREGQSEMIDVEDG